MQPRNKYVIEIPSIEEEEEKEEEIVRTVKVFKLHRKDTKKLETSTMDNIIPDNVISNSIIPDNTTTDNTIPNNTLKRKLELDNFKYKKQKTLDDYKMEPLIPVGIKKPKRNKPKESFDEELWRYQESLMYENGPVIDDDYHINSYNQ
jgi:hypothetical protein